MEQENIPEVVPETPSKGELKILEVLSATYEANGKDFVCQLRTSMLPDQVIPFGVIVGADDFASNLVEQYVKDNNIEIKPYVRQDNIVDISRITRAQGKKALLAAGVYEQVKAYVDDPEQSELLRIGFYDEPYWVITDEFVSIMAGLMKWDGETLQTKFNEASLL